MNRWTENDKKKKRKTGYGKQERSGVIMNIKKSENICRGLKPAHAADKEECDAHFEVLAIKRKRSTDQCVQYHT